MDNNSNLNFQLFKALEHKLISEIFECHSRLNSAFSNKCNDENQLETVNDILSELVIKQQAKDYLSKLFIAESATQQPPTPASSSQLQTSE